MQLEYNLDSLIEFSLQYIIIKLITYNLKKKKLPITRDDMLCNKDNM